MPERDSVDRHRPDWGGQSTLEHVIAITPRTTTAAVLRFAAGGLVALVVLAIGAVLVLRNNARDEALRDARETTRLLADSAVAPALTDDLLSSDPTAIAQLDSVTARLEQSKLARLKIWTDDGTIVYSDEHRLIGLQFELDEHELDILRDGGTAAEVSDLSDPENQFETPGQDLVEVYTKVTTLDGTPLLLEGYYLDEEVSKSASLISRQFIPVVVGALLVFALVQVPLGISLARRMRANQRERETLLHQAIEAGDHERRRIAADLHDGVVQDLAGVSFAIAAASESLRDPNSAPTVARSLDDASRTTRRGIQQLRTLLVDIYPPNLRETGLSTALRDLLAPLANAGVETTFECAEEVGLDEQRDALVYRVAHESVRNALRHASPRRVDLSVVRENGTVTMTVRDDGRGFDIESEYPDGHFGLRSLSDLAAASHADLTIDSQPGRGTTLRLDIEVAT